SPKAARRSSASASRRRRLFQISRGDAERAEGPRNPLRPTLAARHFSPRSPRDLGRYFSPYIATRFTAPTNTFPFATVGTANFTACPGRSRRPASSLDQRRLPRSFASNAKRTAERFLSAYMSV